MARQSRSRLLAPLQERILARILLRPERAWYRSELARELGLSASSLQRPLKSLVAAAILRERQDGNRLYYEAMTENPIFPELRSMLAKTAGLTRVLEDALAPFGGKITLAFVYGSIASGKEAPSSDVDLMIVGTVGLYELAPALREASGRLGREISPAIFSPDEFKAKVQSKNSFLAAVLSKPRLFIVGAESDV